MEDVWRKDLEEFLTVANGKYEQFKKTVILKDSPCIQHTVMCDKAILTWTTDRSDQIKTVELKRK